MQHVHAHVPVTALAWYGEDYILAGEGGYLVVYSIDGNVLSRTCIFVSQAIHGIIVRENANESIAILWGGSLLRPLSLTRIDDALHILLGDVHTAKDWILDASFATTTLAAVVTAHDALTTLRIHRPQSPPAQCPQLILEPRIPGSKCILYSAHLKWLSASHCLIASGTAFGDVILSSTTIDDDESASTQRQVHFSFSAHDGSVFGVRLSSELCVPGQDIRMLLASCSDDRTVRLWDVSDLSTSSAAVQSQRDTGFGSMSKAEAHTPPCLAKVMGHISRIWHVRFAEPKDDGHLARIRSIGEDATVITWTVGLEASAYVFNPIRTVKAHAGKNIWSVACHDNLDLVATGGADGAITVHGEGLLPTMIVEIPGSKSLESDIFEGYRSYAFVAANVLLATTDRGSLVLITLSVSDRAAEIQQVSAPLRGLSTYSIVAAASSMAFCGGTDGTIYLYHHKWRKVHEFATVSGKISGLFAQDQNSGVALLVCTVNSAAASLFMLDQMEDESFHEIPVRTFKLELSEGFVTTSFTHGIGKDSNYAVLGSRNGSIAVYTLPLGAESALSRSQLLKDVHGKEAVTNLQWHTSSCSEKYSLFSTGRDGTVALHTINFSERQPELELVHQLSLPFGPNVEGVLVLHDIGHLIWGFRSKEFVVFDMMLQREVMAIECGGVHRNWTFQPAPNGGRFVWTKASKLFQATQSRPSYDVIRHGGHGREIKVAAISFADGEQIIATGAEDTDIKLFTMYGTSFRCVQTLKKHNTGIQQLQWVGSHLFSSGGFEEFFVWRTRRPIHEIGIGVVCESAHPRSGTSDLRIMGFDVQQTDAQQGFVIAMAYSDSTLKQWRYQQQSWELLIAADYLTSCLTQVLGTNFDERIQWTAATDGHLVSWAVDLERQISTWTKRQKVHQNSIHSVQKVSLGGGESLVITGGDDNAIGLTRITKKDALQTTLIPRAHAAAITGLAVLRLRQDVYGVVSSGIDQRIKLWQIEIDSTRPGPDGLRVKRVYDVFTSVADVSGVGLCALQDGGVGVVIYGVGMDVWRLPWMEESRQ